MMSYLAAVFAGIATVYDIKSRQIPNKLILCMLGTWVLIVLIILLADINRVVAVLINSGLGLLSGGVIFMLVYLISQKGLGGGDVKFMAAAGLYLGLSSTMQSIFYGTLLAAITGVVLILLKKLKRKDKMPLAPFLLAGIIISIILT